MMGLSGSEKVNVLKMAQSLVGRRVVIAGGAGGVGKCVAERMFEEGASVEVLDRAPTVDAVPWEQYDVDLLDRGGMGRWQDFTRGRVAPQVVVNAVGVFSMARFHESDIEEWWRVVEVNVLAVARLTHSLLPSMLATGLGDVINMCSIWSYRGSAERSSYVASKHALIGLNRCLSADYRGTGLRFIAICPGPIDTPMIRDRADESARNGWLTPEVVADVIVSCCLTPGTHLNGAEIFVPGEGSPLGMA